MVDLLIRLLNDVWRVLPLLAIVAALFLLVTSRASARLFSTFDDSPDSPATWLLLVGVLGGLLLSGALERRRSGPSPFETLPGAGRILSLFAGPRISYALCLLACFAVVHALALSRRQGYGRWGRASLVGWAFLTAVVTFVKAEDPPDQALLDLAATTLAFVAVLLLASHLTVDHLRSVVALIGVLLLIVNAYSLRTASSWATTTDWPGGFLEGERFQGTMPQPNVAGLVFACIFVFGMANLRRAPVLWGLVVVGAASFIGLSGSRGAVAVAVGGIAYVFLRRVTVRVVPLTAATMIVLASVVPFTALADAEVIHGRDVTWHGTIDLISRAPFFGSGSYPPVGAMGQSSFYAHNQVLQTLAESGVVGLVLLLGALLGAFWRKESASVTEWSAVFYGLILTIPFENPLRLFEPSFGLVPAIFAIAVAVAASTDESSPDTGRPSRRARLETPTEQWQRLA